jgi:predicted Zn-dependent protease
MIRQIRWRGATVSLVLILLLAGGCAVSDRQVISQASDVHKGIEPAVIDDPELARYFQQIGDRIIEQAEQMSAEGVGPGRHQRDDDTSWMYQGMRFNLVNSKTINAFTTGGKHMYMYNELFQICNSEDELAAVMAHEYAHVYCRHVAKGMERRNMILAGTAGAGLAGAAVGYGQDEAQGALTYGASAAGAALLAGQFIGMGFTRDDENEADKYGFRFYCRAGWDPNRFSGFFQTLIDKGYDKTPEIASDHPKLNSRVQATRERIGQLPPEARNWRRPPIADAARFKQLQQRAQRLGKSMPNDQSLEQAQLMLAAFPNCVTPDDQPEQKRAQTLIAREMRKQQPK